MDVYFVASLFYIIKFEFLDKLYRPSDRRLSAKLVATFAGVVRLRTKATEFVFVACTLPHAPILLSHTCDINAVHYCISRAIISLYNICNSQNAGGQVNERGLSPPCFSHYRDQ
jgi:hypothetical protein